MFCTILNAICSATWLMTDLRVALMMCILGLLAITTAALSQDHRIYKAQIIFSFIIGLLGLYTALIR